MISTQGPWFVDEHGRTLILRGVNLAGSSKVPIGLPTHRLDGFFDHRHVSFVGRPFPLADAGEHFACLREWGLTFVRLVVTWEAIEHAGPGQYDEAYLDYLVEVIEAARQYGICLFKAVANAGSVEPLRYDRKKVVEDQWGLCRRSFCLRM